MAKKKPIKNNGTLKFPDSLTDDTIRIVPEQPPEPSSEQTPLSPVPPAAPNPAQALTNILEAQQQAIINLQKQQQQTNTVLTTMMQRMEVEKEKPATPQDTLKTIMDLLNGPLGNIINKVVDSIGAPAAPETPAVNPVQEEQYKAVQAHNQQMEKFQIDWMQEMVRGVKLRNDQLDREMHAEW